MERLRHPRWRCSAVVLLLLLLAVDLRPTSAAVLVPPTEPTDVPLLDWSEWDEPPPVLLVGRTGPTIGAPTMGSVNRSCLPGECQQQQLRRLVHECSRQLKLPDLRCGDGFVTDDDYRVPLMESLPSCGFEAPTTKGDVEYLADRYSFRFIGDSTTRRLTESFMSIVTGEGSAHPKAQTRIDFSTGNLKVIFDWAPFCSGPLSVGDMLTTVLAEESAEEQGDGVNKRPIIITAFGVHDASYQLQVSQNNTKGWYKDQMPQEVFKQDGWRAAGLSACRQATAQFVRAATGLRAAENETGADLPLWQGGQQEVQEGEEGERGHGGRRRTQEIRERRLRQRQRQLEAGAEAVPGDVGRGDAAPSNVSDTNASNHVSVTNSTEAEILVSSSQPGNGSRWGGLASPPLVFVLQNNGYYNDPGDFQQLFLDEVHRIQRQEIGMGLSEPESENSTSGGVDKKDDGDAFGENQVVNVDDEGAGVFLVDDSESLFGKLSCYRIAPSSHYHEPVKIVEAKVLWDLMALVDRVGDPAPATHDGSIDVNNSGRVGPALVTVWVVTAMVLMVVGAAGVTL